MDRFGARPVLQLCSLGVAIMPAVWLAITSERLWPLAVDAVVAGALWGGHGIAATKLTLGLAPRRHRAAYVAVFAATGGTAFAVSSATSGTLASLLPQHFTVAGLDWTAMHALFAASALARGAAALLARSVDEHAARASDVARALGAEIRVSALTTLAGAGAAVVRVGRRQ